MSLFGNLNSAGLEESQDRLGGYSALESDSYTGKIKLAWAGKSPQGAQFINLVVAFGNTEYRETLYITNRNGENFYLNKNDKTKKVPLPGFTVIDDMCLVTTGKPLCEQSTEEKIVKVWDSTEKKELPKSVPVLVDLLEKEVTLGIIKELQNKTENVNGEHIPIGETREVNIIDKVFHTETGMTVAEARAGQTEGTFHGSWVERNKGKNRDKRTLKDGATGQAGAPKRPAGAAPSANQPARKSLFGNK